MPSVNSGTSTITMAGFMDCICSAPILRPRIVVGTIFAPCKTHVEFVWSLFDQTNSTWVLQGAKMVPTTILGLNIGAEQMQSMNPAIVMVLVPLFTLGIYPRIGRFAAPLKRMAYGMFLAAASYLVVAALQTRIEHGVQLCVLWQTVPYVILTAAEC